MKNPIIATTLYKTGFLESWGTGVSRMVEACKAVGLPEPQYGTDGLFVWITFKRPCSVGNTNDGKGNNSVDSPNNVRVSAEIVDKILSLIKDNPTITLEELAKGTGKTVRTIKKGIQEAGVRKITSYYHSANSDINRVINSRTLFLSFGWYFRHNVPSSI